MTTRFPPQFRITFSFDRSSKRNCKIRLSSLHPNFIPYSKASSKVVSFMLLLGIPISWSIFLCSWVLRFFHLFYETPPSIKTEFAKLKSNTYISKGRDFLVRKSPLNSFRAKHGNLLLLKVEDKLKLKGPFMNLYIIKIHCSQFHLSKTPRTLRSNSALSTKDTKNLAKAEADTDLLCLPSQTSTSFSSPSVTL